MYGTNVFSPDMHNSANGCLNEWHVMYIDFSLKSTNRDLWRLEYVSFYSNHTIQYSVYYKLLSMRANLQHMALLSVRGIKKHFGGVIVLDGVDMDLERGKVYQLIGSNGSGKTTLVDIISGRIHSDEGNVILDGNDITQSGQLETYRAGLVRTFQIPRPFRKLATIENMSVSATGNPGETFVKASIYRLWRKRERQVYEKASSITKWIGLGSRANEESQNLSGGQQKLLETGRVMMMDPKIVLLDEPIAGVNPSLAHHIFKKIREVAEKQNVTFLIIEHRLDISLEYSDHVFALDGGRIIAQGDSDEILKHPAVIESYLGE